GVRFEETEAAGFGDAVVERAAALDGLENRRRRCIARDGDADTPLAQAIQLALEVAARSAEYGVAADGVVPLTREPARRGTAQRILRREHESRAARKHCGLERLAPVRAVEVGRRRVDDDVRAHPRERVAQLEGARARLCAQRTAVLLVRRDPEGVDAGRTA